ncbi:hypothetical protein BpHYR1_007389 [Brachionus plicatilis]|uniref:Uncharacterized protein n=1 Tax=Brachionus plicatilis TaxID=10195 RepID=A0A3M7PKH2_BRAPC|nr:hypothetical protein BpHYR1_007389 [Brachionus plicatilis]
MRKRGARIYIIGDSYRKY